MHVAAAGHDTAVGKRRQVKRGAEQEPGVGHRLAVDAQPRHATVGVLAQPYVRDPRRIGNGVGIATVSLRRRARNQRQPVGGGQLLRRRVALDCRALDRHLRRVVTGEERRVHDDTTHHAGHAEPDHRPVMTRLPAPAAFPTVHDLALVAERVRGEGRRLGLDEVLPLCEELVVRGGHAAAESPRGQIGQTREVSSGSQTPPRVSNRPRGASPEISSPCSQVLRTTPASGRPAYGVTGFLCRSRTGSTSHASSGAKTAKSASYPSAT